MEMSVEIEIDGPKSKVWSAITDIQNCAKMLSGIIDLKILDQPAQGLIGLKWTETREIFGKASSETLWITECVDEEYYCTRAENCGAIYTTKMAVTEVNTKTLLTMSFSGTSESFFIRVFSSLMGLFIKKAMVKMLQQDLDDIKRYVEQD